MQIDNFIPNYSLNTEIGVVKRKAQLENNVLELEREKRTEYLECWRDLMFLKIWVKRPFRPRYLTLVLCKDCSSFTKSSSFFISERNILKVLVKKVLKGLWTR